MSASGISSHSGSSRFWARGSDSDESTTYSSDSSALSDDEATPPCSPVKTGAVVSPVSKLQQMITKRSPSCAFMLRESICAQKGLERLKQEIPDQPGPQGRSGRARGVFSAVCKKLSFNDPESVNAHQHAYRTLTSNPHFSEVVGALIEIDGRAQFPATDMAPAAPFVNVDHIFNVQIRGSSITGCHYLPQVHRLAQYQENRTDHASGSGMYVASIKMRGLHKRSTFFPDVWTEKQVLNAIRSATELYRSESRRLCKDDETPFYIETVWKEGVVVTAYPIFFFKRFQQEQKYQIGDGSAPVSAEAFYRLACALIQEYQDESHQVLSEVVEDPIRYSAINGFGEMEWIVELSSALYPERADGQFSPRQEKIRAQIRQALPVTCVPKGIYFRIPALVASKALSSPLSAVDDYILADD